MEFDDDDDPPASAPAWMATFADMATLLLTFFVLMLSFANLDIKDFKMALGSVRDALGVVTKRPGYFEARASSPVEWENDPTSSVSETGKDQAIIAQIEAIIERRGLADRVELLVDDDNIILRLKDLFPPASAILEPRSFDDLEVVVDLCRSYGQPVRVEAHTDDQPIRTAQFSSNWELSAVRAGTVARYLVEAGRIGGERVTAGGVAHMRPIAPNTSAEGRAKNRRVDVVLARAQAVTGRVNEAARW